MKESLILINSTASDQSTNDIIDWLLWFKKKHIRINEDNIIYLTELNFEKFNCSSIVKIGNVDVNLSEISRYFYRRGYLNIKISDLFYGIRTDVEHKFAKAYLKYLKGESDKIIDLIKKIIQEKNGILSFEKAEINKLDFLYHCNMLNINTPETAIVNSKTQLKEYKKKWGNLISKPLNRGFFFTIDEWFYCHTTRIRTNDLEFFDERFTPTLIQREIRKLFEIRIFFIYDKIFANCIFSQNDKQTELDFRNYNRIKPNRNVPFSLPLNLKNKVLMLKQSLKMETGSIDVIYSTDKIYYFLELNPIGQFAQVSFPSNYYIEKHISEIL